MKSYLQLILLSMSKPEDEQAKEKLEEIVLNTKKEIIDCCKCMFWIVSIFVGILACLIGGIYFYVERNETIDENAMTVQILEVLKKLKKLEERQEMLQVTVDRQEDLIKELQDKLRTHALTHWGDWSSWSDCYMNCTGRNGGRVQSRSRESIGHSSTHGIQKETEDRPCNAVQFAGCIKNYGKDDNFGVTYDFADQIAVSTCTALLPGASSHVYAVRRTCSNLAVSCEHTCKHVGTTCFNALHIYRGSKVLQRDQDGAKGLYTYKYNSCGGGCGPNFCCCRDA